VVVRTYGAGVHVGWLARYVGQEAELLEGRRLWRWYGANTLLEVAVSPRGHPLGSGSGYGSGYGDGSGAWSDPDMPETPQ